MNQYNSYKILNAISTDDHLLFSLTDFISKEITLHHFRSNGHELYATIDVDTPIEILFGNIINENNFGLIVVSFELHHGLNIPDELVNTKLSLREFVREVSKLPKATPSEYKVHLEAVKQLWRDEERYDAEPGAETRKYN